MLTSTPLDPGIADRVAAYPPPGDYKYGPDGYANHLVKVKQAVRIPVIASLNGHTGESWLKFAHIIEQAGADALEFNYYDVATALTVSSAALEEHLISAVRNLTQVISIPVAIKLTPFYTAFGHVAAALDRAGASGLVLFNRFYQPDVNTRTMTLVPQAELSTSAELPLRLHWLALLRGRVRPALAASGGVATPDDGIKALLAGADVVQLVSALLRHGPGHIGAMRRRARTLARMAAPRLADRHDRPRELRGEPRPQRDRAGPLHPHASELDAMTSTRRV